MYSYLDEKNLNYIYDLLMRNSMFDLFIKAVVEENDLYKKMIQDIKTYKKALKQEK